MQFDSRNRIGHVLPSLRDSSSALQNKGNPVASRNSFKFVMLPPQNDTTRGWAKRLAEAVPEVRVVVAEDADTAQREIVDAEAAFGWLGKDLLAKARNLRWLQAPQAAPAAGYFYPELTRHSVTVTNFREIYNDHIGAHILAFVLAFARGLHLYIPRQLRREWKKSPEEAGDVLHLPETTALVVGVGGIGAEAARLLAAFGVKVLATDARRAEPPSGVAELHRPEALDELLPRADFVILTVPHTPATEGFFNRARFQRMKRTAFFINIGRGMTTKLDDLVAALRAGEIAGAALDVYEIEPLPTDHPLWTMPNVLLTPHMAGHGPYLDDRRFEIIADNCRAFATGSALRNQVDKASWF
jgi:phosphoglycerate dehydrogenase-like enzyme